MAIPVWVRLHDGDPGMRGLDNLAGVAPMPAEKVVGRHDPYGLAEIGVLVTFKIDGLRCATHYSVWGGEDGCRLLGGGTLDGGRRLCVRDGTLTIDSITPTTPGATNDNRHHDLWR